VGESKTAAKEQGSAKDRDERKFPVGQKDVATKTPRRRYAQPLAFPSFFSQHIYAIRHQATLATEDLRTSSQETSS